MHADDSDKLKDYFAQQVLSQVQSSVNDDENELQQQHDQKCNGDFVLFQIGCYTAIALGRLEINRFGINLNER